VDAPDFLVIGHVTKDIKPYGFTIGGTVTYSSVTACRLGRRAAVLTRADPDFDLRTTLRDIEIVRLPSPVTTTFENLYQDGHRLQFLNAIAPHIAASDVPEMWRRVPIVHLGPLVREIGLDMLDLFSDALVGVTPQGWMRQWDGDLMVQARRRVWPKPWDEAEAILPRVDVLVFSEEDVAGDRQLIERYASLAKIAVVTQGARGATVHWQGRERHFPARPTTEVDPTGAGDVFAAAYLIRLAETDDPYEAAMFANVVASFSVEQEGIVGIPTRAQVEAWRVSL
jgi:sugar/nucleoside kinase (ribokinase family)